MLRRAAPAVRTHRDEGQGLVEYSLILLMVALAVFAALGIFGGNLGVIYQFILSSLPF
jgi:Flp pilus assembly pilin Flp